MTSRLSSLSRKLRMGWYMRSTTGALLVGRIPTCKGGGLSHAPTGVLDGPATATRPVSAASILTNVVRAGTVHIRWLRTCFRGRVPEGMYGCPRMGLAGSGRWGRASQSSKPRTRGVRRPRKFRRDRLQNDPAEGPQEDPLSVFQEDPLGALSGRPAQSSFRKTLERRW